MSVLKRAMPSLIRDALDKSVQYKKRVVVVGTRGSSKTTALGCLSLTCDSKTLGSNGKFTSYIEEFSSGILNAPALLKQGKFPEGTPKGFLYEANLLMRWKESFGSKEVVLPFCETAGEDMETLLGPHGRSIYGRQSDYQENVALAEYICNSHGYIVAIPVSRAKIGGVAREPLPMGVDGKPMIDPDVNVRRILAAIHHYKRITNSPPIEGIAVLLTKYDMIDDICKAHGMDLYTDAGSARFLQRYFPMTSALLMHHGLEKVRFFPVHVQVRKEKKDGKLIFTNDIVVDYENNLPEYSERSYLALIDWIKETFAK